MGKRLLPPEERERRQKEKRQRQYVRCRLDPICMEKRRETTRKHYRNSRQKFLDMYGRKCACCGESIEEFLVIDHIGGGRGNRLNESPSVAYKKATTHYQPKVYQTLCHNCNHSYGLRGYCPHKGRPAS